MKSNKTSLILILIMVLVISGCSNINEVSDLRNSGLIIHDDNNSMPSSNQDKNSNMPPSEAIAACSGKNIGDTCQFIFREETLTGLCDEKPGVLACAPSREKREEQKTNLETSNNINLSNFTFDSCINNTSDNPQCKDCCDCLSGITGQIRTNCRDTCAAHDFNKNTKIVKIIVPSKLGKEGDYSVCVNKMNSSECKSCCEGSLGLECGDYQYCRTACNNKFGDAKHNITPSIT